MSEIPQQMWLNMITNLSIRIVGINRVLHLVQSFLNRMTSRGTAGPLRNLSSNPGGSVFACQGFEKGKGEILSGVQEVLLEDARWFKAAWRRLKAIQIHVLQIRSLLELSWPF